MKSTSMKKIVLFGKTSQENFKGIFTLVVAVFTVFTVKERKEKIIEEKN